MAKRIGTQELEDQARALHHVVYEMSMIFATAERLRFLDPSEDQVLFNALVESHALHVRNTFEFLCDEYKQGDAIRLSHFGLTPVPVEADFRERWGRLYGYASTRVAHLTWKRLLDNPGMPTADMPLVLREFLHILDRIDPSALGLLDDQSSTFVAQLRAIASPPLGVQC